MYILSDNRQAWLQGNTYAGSPESRATLIMVEQGVVVSCQTFDGSLAKRWLRAYDTRERQVVGCRRPNKHRRSDVAVNVNEVDAKEGKVKMASIGKKYKLGR